jgi:hypothetical protein
MAGQALPRLRYSQKPSVHTRGIGRCPECANRELRMCPHCGKHSIHFVSTWSAYRQEVCENGCTTLAKSGYVTSFQAEMKDALRQFDERELERKKAGQ